MERLALRYRAYFRMDIKNSVIFLPFIYFEDLDLMGKFDCKIIVSA